MKLSSLRAAAGVALCAISLTFSLPSYAKLEEGDVQSMIAHIEQTIFPNVAVSDYKLTHLKNGEVIKTFGFEMTLKEDNSLLVMNWPATSKHKYLLKAAANLWMYFSDVRRSIRLSARDSFMGTDANNYDLMQLNLLKDYTVEGFEETTLNGEPMMKVELRGKDSSEGYDKIISWISIKERRMVQNECYSISGKLIKTVTYDEMFAVGDYLIPGKVTIASNVNKGRSTLMEISNVRPMEPQEVRDFIFTLGYLETVP